MHCGIEFEYLLIDLGGATPARLRDFSNLPFEQISAWLEDKPGRDDAELATGDLGIKRGYWYLEGNERFHDDGRFRTLDVKGVEIRTPPAADVETALQRLVAIETQLSAALARHGLGLAITAFNPVRAPYAYDPPLNAWEAAMRAEHRAYDGSHISTLSYGPDINLSMPGWSNAQCLDATRKLQHYAPWIVPFSFASPFAHGRRWPGWSKRTHERAPLRQAVKLFLDAQALAAPELASTLVHPARIAQWEFLVFVCLDPDAPELAHDLGDLLLDPGIIGQFVDALDGNHGGVHVGDQQPLLTVRPTLLLKKAMQFQFLSFSANRVGENAIDHSSLADISLHQIILRAEAERYAAWARAHGYGAATFTALGHDVMGEVMRLAAEARAQFPNSVFFAGQLAFECPQVIRHRCRRASR